MQKGKNKMLKIYKSSHTQLKEGDIICFQQNDKFWKPGQVQNRLNDRSYIIKSQEGGTFRKNRRHIMKSQENVTIALQVTPHYNILTPTTVQRLALWKQDKEQVKAWVSAVTPTACYKSTKTDRTTLNTRTVPHPNNHMLLGVAVSASPEL